MTEHQPPPTKRLKHLNWGKYLLVTSPILLILLLIGGYWIFENITGAQRLKEVDSR